MKYFITLPHVNGILLVRGNHMKTIKRDAFVRSEDEFLQQYKPRKYKNHPLT